MDWYFTVGALHHCLLLLQAEASKDSTHFSKLPGISAHAENLSSAIEGIALEADTLVVTEATGASSFFPPLMALDIPYRLT
mmetsp:Transcript_3432/g.4461  ORF Transcript_3432/g.4461 Transcript_3432/m.4461 type:complete len:81 (+) Transcript_3432:100-342(+)